ncbi:unnamed protein product [Euphydryas editha]|uniref:FLYWCH-type domain-containing protein n=1 Tax=Euphydryas editha TaxID=104508 RepID=A0AAU9TM46_EUPED|nr:unnamed protein product [Euphydryas editha]
MVVLKVKYFADVLEYVPSHRGKGMMLIYKGHTYWHITSKTRWYCSKKKKGCRAKIQTAPDGELVAVIESHHNHPPPTLYRTEDGNILRSIEIHQNARGNGFSLVYGGYTFSHMHTNNKTRWYCSKRVIGCKAKIITTPDGELVQVTGEHNHYPPNLYRTNDGRIVRLSRY